MKRLISIPAILVLAFATHAQQRSVSGRVIHAETGEGVRGFIIMGNPTTPSDFEYFADREGVSDDDGTFHIEGLQAKPYMLRVNPTKQTLYAIDGNVLVDLSESSVEGLELHVGEGCAILGTVETENDAPVDQPYVTLMNGPDFYRLEPVSKTGKYTFRNLPPGPLTVELICGDVREKYDLPDPGTIVRNHIITIQPRAMSSIITGIALSEDGERLVDIDIWAHLSDSDGKRVDVAHSDTDENGVFRLELNGTGSAKFSAHRTYRFNSFQFKSDYRILNETEIAIDSPASQIDHDLQMEVLEAQYIRGVVRTNQAEQVRPRIEYFAPDGAENSPTTNVNSDEFIVAKITDLPFSIMLKADGYIPRVLTSGIDFEIGDENIEVVLKPGPYAAEEPYPVWEEITGRPFTEEEVNRTPGAEDIILQAEWHRDRAVPEDMQPPREPEPEAAPAKIDIHVIDHESNPVTRIVVRKATSPPVEYDRILPDEAAMLDQYSGAEIFRSETGHYTIDNFSLVTARGMSKAIAGTLEALGLPKEITLYPEGTIQVTVLDYAGEPVVGAHVFPMAAHQYTAATGSGFGSWPDTNSEGVAVLDGFSPGLYTIGALYSRPVGSNPAIGYASVDMGDRAECEIRWGEPVPGTPEDHFQILAGRRHRDDPRPEDWIENASNAEKNAVADLLREKLRNTPEINDYNSREIQRYFYMMESLDEKFDAADLRRLAISVRSVIQWNEHHVASTQGMIYRALAYSVGEGAIGDLRIQAFDMDNAFDVRMAAFIGLANIGTPDAIAVLDEACEIAAAMPGAPELPEDYTHAQRMTERYHLLAMFAGKENVVEAHKFTHGAVDEDYITGRASFGNSYGDVSYRFKRFGDRWYPTEYLGATAI